MASIRLFLPQLMGGGRVSVLLVPLSVVLQCERMHTHVSCGPVTSRDAPAELDGLRRLLPEMVRFEPTWEELELYKDGGVAIVDQWVCAHAR